MGESEVWFWVIVLTTFFLVASCIYDGTQLG